MKIAEAAFCKGTITKNQENALIDEKIKYWTANVELYAVGEGRRVNVYMRKDIIATKYLVVDLYTDNDVITVASVNPSGSGFNISNQGIDTGSTLFAITNKHSILFSNANLFDNETDFLLFSFDVNYVVFDSVYGSDDFELRISAYESITENDFIAPKFIASKTHFTYASIFANYLSSIIVDPAYEYGTNYIDFPIVLHKRDGEFTRSFKTVVWYATSMTLSYTTTLNNTFITTGNFTGSQPGNQLLVNNTFFEYNNSSTVYELDNDTTNI